MSDVDSITEDMSKYFDEAVRELGQEEYRDVTGKLYQRPSVPAGLCERGTRSGRN